MTGPAAGAPDPAQAALRATDRWFLAHGLSYFVPEERAAVRRALAPGRLWLPALLVVVVAAGCGVLVAWASGDVAFGPALLLTLGGTAALLYGVTALRAGPILGWALSRTFGSLRRLLPTAARALPLLLVFVTFFFLAAETWEMAAAVPGGSLWLVVLLFVGLSGAFLLVRLPEEVDRVDDDVDAAFLRRACRGTPLEQPCEELLADPDASPEAYAEVRGFERWNLILALVVIQLTQVLLIAVAVFVFFLVFGSLVMGEGIQLAWTGVETLGSFSWLPSVSTQLVRVSLFLSTFSVLYLTVSTVTDETFREQFFGTVLRELERAVGMRAVYLALRDAGR